MLQKKLLVIIFSFILSTSVFCANKNVVAVFDFTGVNGRINNSGKTFSSFLFIQLSKYKKLEMVERKELAKILTEKKLKSSGLAKSNYLDMAAIVNADFIITGRIYQDQDENINVINIKLTSCKDGKIIGKAFTEKISKGDKYLETISIKAAAFIAKEFGLKNPQ